MFNCYLHGWSDKDRPCPVCFPIVTITTTNGLYQYENFKKEITVENKDPEIIEGDK